MGKEDEQTRKKVRFFQALLNAGFNDTTTKWYPEKKYSEDTLSCYANMMKRAFEKGTYFVNCDYGDVYINIGERSEKMAYEAISDKLIALVIFLGSLKSENSRYKFGRYKFNDFNEVYDIVMTTYPYDKMNKARKEAIEYARTQLPKILEEVRSIS